MKDKKKNTKLKYNIVKKVVGKEMFDSIVNGEKNFDARVNDFEAKKGDIILFKEWDKEKNKYTGREVKKKISFVLKSKDYNNKFWNEDEILKKGFLIFGFENNEKNYLEGWQRSKADLVNLQNRIEKENANIRKFTKYDTIIQMLSIKDNFDSALKFIPKEIQDNPWLQGISYIEKQFDKFLEDNKVSIIKVEEGDVFDPSIHEALENKDNKENDLKERDINIKKILKKGYKIGEDILRPTLVEV